MIVINNNGGGGQVFAQTTNPIVSTGDGVALAWQSGAILRDLEFVQFHPTAFNKADAPHFLISEAIRGEGFKNHSPFVFAIYFGFADDWYSIRGG